MFDISWSNRSLVHSVGTIISKYVNTDRHLDTLSIMQNQQRLRPRLITVIRA